MSNSSFFFRRSRSFLPKMELNINPRYLFLFLALVALTRGSRSPYTIMELRHDCSDSNPNPLIEKDLWTTVVYRLKAPILEKCQGKMDRQFTWRFRLDPDMKCLAMLGCHELDGMYDQVLGKEVFDVNVTVNRVVRDDVTGDHEHLDTFQITQDGHQKFYSLTGGESIQMNLQYRPDVEDQQKPTDLLCFAWCNEDFDKKAPVRTTTPTPTTPSTNWIEDIENSAEITMDLGHKNEDIQVSPAAIYRMTEPNEICQDEQCQIRYSFFWLAENSTCYSKFLCTKMEGRVCDTFGVKLTHANADESVIQHDQVCQAKMLIRGSLTTSQRAHIDLWYQKKNPNYQAVCFFWCTKDGQLPNPENDNDIDHELKGRIVQGQWKTHFVQPQVTTKTILISPVAHYNITEPITGNQCDEGQKCQMETVFRWKGSMQCQGKFICSTLGGNICGQYGLKASCLKASEDICYEAQTHSFTLNKDETFRLKYWYTNSATTNKLVCHLWCNEGGEEPVPLPESNVQEGLIDTLLSSTHQVRSIDLKSKPVESDIVPISPSLIYKFKIDSQGPNEDCRDKPCRKSLGLSWKRDFQCQARFICTLLNNNVCGDYGLNIDMDANSELDKRGDICYRNRMQTWTMSQGHNSTLDLWWYLDTEFQATCYLWCSKDGNAPMAPKNGPISKELLQSLASGETKIVQLPNGFTKEIPRPESKSLSFISVYSLNFGLTNSNCDQSICTKTWKLQWMGGHSISMGFFISSVTGFIGGNYGLQIGNGNSDEDLEAYFVNRFHEVNLESGQTFTITLWFTEGSSFSFQLYTWAHANGNFQRVPEKKLENQLLMNLINGSLHIESTTLDKPHGEDILNAVAFSKVYHFSITSSDLQIKDKTHCHGDRCHMDYEFTWFVSQKCYSNFLCTKLEGNVCGSYGINLKFESQFKALSVDQHVCYNNHIYSDHLNYQDKLGVDLWYMDGTGYAVDCYLWCTPDGKLPTSINSRVDANQISSLVGGGGTLYEFSLVPGSDSGNAKALSPVVVYQTTIGKVDFSGCKADKCYRSFMFQSRSKEGCQFAFVCSRLEDQPCGNFGIDLQYPAMGSSVDQVCHSGAIHRSNMESGDTANITVWHMADANVDAQCFAWCTPDGQIPFLPDSNGQGASALLQDLLSATENVVEVELKANQESSTLSPVNIYHFSSQTSEVTCSTDAGNEERCSISRRFTSVNDMPLKLSIIFSQLEGNVCGDFGIEVSRGNGAILESTRDVCQQGQIKVLRIGEYDFITVTLWFYRDSSVAFSGYLWATSDGKLPSTGGTTNDQTLLSIGNRDNQVQMVQLGGVESGTTSFSPVQIYRFSSNNDDSNCTETKCLMHHNFDWLYSDEICLANILCSKLSGNACGDFGIRMTAKNMNSKQSQIREICYPDVMYQTIMESSKLLDVALWHTKGAEFEAECYLWCSDDGYLPDEQLQDNRNDLLVQSLINGSTLIQTISLTTIPNGRVVSPVYVYHTSNAKSTLPSCLHDRCSVSYSFTNMGRKPCQASMICSSLNGNVCGDFGMYFNVVNSDANGNPDPGPKFQVCQKGQLFRTSLPKSSSVELNLWYDGDADLLASCFFWCTADGTLPQRQSTNSINDNLILQLLRGRFHVNRIQMASSNETHSVSPQTVYFTNQTASDKFDFCANGNCFQRYRFDYHGESTCTSKFICTKLTENICGDYGLTLLYSLRNQGDQVKDLCHENELIVQQLNEGESAELILWSVPDSDYNMQCYFWCTSDGELPGVRPQPDSRLLESLVNGTANVKRFDLVEDVSTKPLSPVLVYSTLHDSTDQTVCSTDKCYQYYKFQWNNDEPCLSNFICNQLNGNPCGDYGLVLSYSNDESDLQSSSVCHRGHTYRQELKPFQHLDLTLWSVENATFSYSCYFWCTGDGSIPRKPQTYTIQSETLESIANGSTSVQTVKILPSEDQSPLYVSPTTIYKTIQMQNDTSGSSCQGDKCQLTYRFSWLGEEPCNSSFVCHKLDGNPCADYGLQLRFNGQEDRVPVCYEGQLHMGQLDTNDFIDISLWHLPHSIFDSNCYLWCTDNGKLPQPRSTSEAYEDLVLAFMNGSRTMEQLSMSQSDAPDTKFVSPNIAYKIQEQNVLNEQDSKDTSISNRSLKFGWLGQETCYAHLLCLVLDGNICGNYGLSFSVNGQDEPVCYEREILEGTMNQEETTEISLWHANNAEFGTDCYFWCTTDGDIPNPEPDTTKNDELVAQLIEQTNPVKKLELSLIEDTTLTISQVNVYELNVVQNSFGTCKEEDRCKATIQLDWLAKEPEQWNFICTKLKGNICGDYGVQINENDGTPIDICYEGEIHKGRMKSPSSLNISVWFAPEALYEVRCYFWATKDGHLPKTISKGNNNEDIIQALVQGSDILREVRIGAQETTSSSLSTAFVYRLSVDSSVFKADPSTYQDGTCSHSFTFNYHRNHLCHLHFICPTLGETICGDHGLELEHSGSTQDVCYQGQVYREDLEQSDSLEIEVWYRRGIELQASCYLWCAQEPDSLLVVDNIEEDDTVLMQVINGSTRVKRNVEDFEGQDQIISPNMIYNIDLTNDMFDNSLEGQQSYDYTFQWFGDETCVASFMCSELTGHTCGDYGLELTSGNGTESDYCYPKDRRRAHLSYRERARITLWRMPEAEFGLKCFFWCTGKGTPPTLDQNNESVNPQFIDEMINSALMVKIDLESSSLQDHYLSPVNIYQGQLTSDNLPKCEEDKCRASYQWKYAYPKDCHFKLVCTLLSGNPCGDFGLELVDDSLNEIQICSANSIYKTTLKSGQSLDINMWWISQAEFETNCYAWCSHRGSLPATNGEDTELDDMIMEKAMSGSLKLESTNLLETALEPQVISFGVVYHFKVDGSVLVNEEGNLVERSRDFLWLGEERCQASLVCSKMNGNTCGSYGLSVKYGDSEDNINICSSSKMVSGFLEHNQKATIGSWNIANTQDMEMTCFFWCNPNGTLPMISSDSEGGDELIEELVSSTHNVKDIILTNDLKQGSLSSALIYHITGKEQEFQDCSTVKCRMAFRFQYLASSSCDYGFVCSSMKGNPCGSYGIKLKPLNEDQTPINVCHAGQVALGTLRFQEELEVRLWHNHEIKENPTCYFWCTEDGSLPQARDAWSKPDDGILSELTSGTSNTKILVINGNGSSQALAPSNIYQVHVDVPKCSQDRCSVSESLEWFGDQTCQAKLLCSNLNENACAEFGLNLRFGHSKTLKVCQNDTIYQASLTYPEKLDLEFWYVGSANPGVFNCYFWCTMNGSLPQTISGNKAEEELIGALISGAKNERKVSFGQSGSGNVSNVIIPLAPNYIYQVNANSLEINHNSNDTQKNITSLSFGWLWPKTCQARFACQTLNGNPCGDYGLKIFTSNQNHSVCQAGDKFKDQLDFNEILQLRLWYMSEAQFDFKCFLWCTENGQLPEDKPSATVKKELIVKIMNGSEITKQVTDEDTPVAPSTIYKAIGNSSQLQVCQETTCSKTFKFTWYGDAICQAKLVCPTLTGNTCGDYGMSLTFPDNQLKVCQESYLYEGDLTTNQGLELELWYSQSSLFTYECYLWCTENGVVPQPHHDSQDSSVQISTLVRMCTFFWYSDDLDWIHVFQVNGSSNTEVLDITQSKPVIVSTSKIYAVGLNSKSLETCDTIKCWLSQRIEYFGDEPCQTQFVCPLLSGSPCGDYQLTLQFPNHSQSVCHESTIYDGVLEFNTDLELSLWYTESAQFDLSCYMWCSINGQIPTTTSSQASDQSDSTSSLITDLINGNETSETLDPPMENGDSTPLSPTAIYHFKLNESDLPQCQDQLRCDAHYQFQWLWEEPCHVMFVCNQLTDNICGDYGLELEQADASENREICFPQRIYESQLGFYYNLKVSFWYLQKAKFNVECHFWCAHEGSTPAKPGPNSTIEQETVDALMEATTNMRKLECSVGMNDTVPMAANKVYKIKQSPNTFPKCSNDSKCSLSHNFAWLNPDTTCNFTMVCGEMTSQPCSNYGLTIKRSEEDQEAKMCHANEKFFFQLRSGQLDREEIISQIRIPSTKSSVRINPNKVYHIKQGLQTCQEGAICQSQLNFRWDGPVNGCNGTFICPKLNGHPCGDYQISWRPNGSNTSYQACEVNQAQNSYLDPGQRAHVNLWYTSRSSQEWECFFQCKENRRTTDKCDCGRNNVKKRREEDSSYPWQVQIIRQERDGFEFVCSGALVSKNSVITSAHCFGSCPESILKNGTNAFKVVIGKSRMSDPKDNEVISNINSLYIHPKFQLQPTRKRYFHPQYDLAIAILEESATRSKPICLPMDEHDHMDLNQTMMVGWGARNADQGCGYAWFDKQSNEWLHTPSKVIYSDEVRGVPMVLHKPNRSIGPDVVLGQVKSRADMNEFGSCQGNSGSPLMTRSPNGKLSLVGIASFGSPSCDPNEPVGFIKIAYNIKWIEEILGRQCP
ncbi:hypothetical protein TCAL_04995 [Tigriopus californicus]|uniref:Peptidase S1 domain-containing protein n=1 Tax=Tigriopus californicus TaxID=6832 RepID=A0A553PLN5_TIGCA|nr:hypothetical protein TCAL_04995 [Tigriopus californicus]|eukprot:TCALIF_04995-PA protein Name:"Similar to Tmprss6 Transmembrane protease serine 6 (Mus musculus)" AED:0.01 eAED:0.01 QI:0/0.96/0.76/1/0.96/0.92/26/114/4423